MDLSELDDGVKLHLTHWMHDMRSRFGNLEQHDMAHRIVETIKEYVTKRAAAKSASETDAPMA
jgi:hypothetical protein